jgi:acyl carrier protein
MTFEGPPPVRISDDAIRDVVLQAMRATNQARDAASQLVVSADAPIFGPDSSLDSLGLVGLLLDVEEGLQAIGCDVVLSDERAVSQKRSPFRNVQTLVAYVSTLARE